MVENFRMHEERVLRIDDCLSDESFDAWTKDVVAQVEAYLAKHAAFESFLNGED